MITPTPLWRSNKAPKYTYEPWWGEDGAPPKTELPTPECPAEEIDSEPDMAKLKAWKIMKEEKKRDEMIAKKEDEKSEKAIKAAEEEQTFSLKYSSSQPLIETDFWLLQFQPWALLSRPWEQIFRHVINIKALIVPPERLPYRKDTSPVTAIIQNCLRKLYENLLTAIQHFAENIIPSPLDACLMQMVEGNNIRSPL